MPFASCRHRGGATFFMDVFGASWENKIIYSYFFSASILLSTGELWNATKNKKSKCNLIYGESHFGMNSEPLSQNLV